MTQNNDPIVGHKSMTDGTRQPLHKSEADAIFAACEAADKKRRDQMPDSMAAISTLHDAITRLRDEGWREGIYCPKDGSEFAVIEFGSTGIFSGVYMGQWPKGYVIMGGCSTDPHGILWKPQAHLTDAEKARQDGCIRAEREIMDAHLKAFSQMDLTE